MNRQTVECPSCKKSIRAAAKEASYKARCPSCGMVLDIPGNSRYELDDVQEVLAATTNTSNSNKASNSSPTPIPPPIIQKRSRPRKKVSISLWLLAGICLMGPLLGATIALAATGSLTRPVQQVAKAIPVVAAFAEPEKKAVREWLQDNHPDPDGIEEIEWFVGNLDPFWYVSDYESYMEFNNIIDSKNCRYAWLKMRHGNGVFRGVSSTYYVLNDLNEVERTLYYCGSYDNPNENRKKPMQPRELTEEEKLLENARQQAADAQARRGNDGGW